MNNSKIYFIKRKAKRAAVPDPYINK